MHSSRNYILAYTVAADDAISVLDNRTSQSAEQLCIDKKIILSYNNYSKIILCMCVCVCVESAEDIRSS